MIANVKLSTAKRAFKSDNSDDMRKIITAINQNQTVDRAENEAISHDSCKNLLVSGLRKNSGLEHKTVYILI